MQCRHCGMDSRTVDACEWCHKPLTGAQSLDRTVAMPPGSQPTLQMQTPTVKRVALTGEVIETTQALPTMPPPGAYPPPSSGPPYAGMPASSLGSALPSAAYSPHAIQQQFQEMNEVPLGEKWEKLLAIALPILACSMLLVHFAPGALWLVAYSDLFFIGLAMGVTGAIPSFDDAILDCSVVLIVAMFFGPLIALGGALFVGLVKQEVNPAILALLGLNLLVKLLLGYAFASTADTISMLAMWGLFNWFGFVGVCISFFGWMCSSFFRRLDA
jgi:hypothetical protein